MPTNFDPSKFPTHIYGIHDFGGESHFTDLGKSGWILDTVIADGSPGADYSNVGANVGVVVRLNNGYGSAGTIPHSDQYDAFAQRCTAWVAGSKNARVWIIGNEPNLAAERPGNTGANDGEVITPDKYADCFRKCRAAIKNLAEHADDLVIPAPVGPYNNQTQYAINPSGDWVKYLTDILALLIGADNKPQFDALALHAYTHGFDPALLASEEKMGSFPNRNYHFRAYRDFLCAIPPTLRNLPVFLTETNPLPGWENRNIGWIRAAYKEINDWNSVATNQPIQALLLFRWRRADHPEWALEDKPALIADFRAAVANDYRVRWPGVAPVADYRAQWISVVNVPGLTMTPGAGLTGRVVMKNVGSKAWLITGSNPVRIGYHWYDAQGRETPVVPDPGHFNLPQNILPNQTAIVDNVLVRAPQALGTYTLKWDLVQEGLAWFAQLGSPTKDVTITIAPPEYAAEFVEVVNVPNNTMAPNSTLTGRVIVKNTGARIWNATGLNPVRLNWKWFNAQGLETFVVPYAGNFSLTQNLAPGQTATFDNVELRAPSQPGTYTLRWDMVLEGITFFSARGSPTRDLSITVPVPVPDLAARWISVFDLPDTLAPNAVVKGSVVVQNAGGQTWNAAGANPVRLGYHWYDAAGGGAFNETPLPAYPGDLSLAQDVFPNASATIDNVVVKAPATPGEFVLKFDMVKEGVHWFNEVGSPTFNKTITVKIPMPDYAAQFLETVPIPNQTMGADTLLVGRVVVKNAGALTWRAGGANPVRLGFKWINASGQATPDKMDRGLQEAPVTPYAGNFNLAQDVAPGETVTIENVQLRAPQWSGRYTLKFDMVHEGVTWFEQRGSQPHTELVTVTPGPVQIAFGAQFLAHDTPVSLATGQVTTVNLRVKNVGKNPWPQGGSHPVHAAYKWFNAAGQQQLDVEDRRTALPNDVAPGQEVAFGAALAAPKTSGTYNLRWDLVAEGLTFFADGGNPPLVVPVSVKAFPSSSTGWRAEASVNPAEAGLALDGNSDTFWSSKSAQTKGMWFRVSFGAPRLMDAIAFRSPGQGYPDGYTVRVSADGQTWNVVGGFNAGNARDVVVTFAPQNVLYAQIDLYTTPSDGRFWMLTEMLAHLGAAWTATASVNNTAASKTIDNDLKTFWTTDAPQAPNMWFQLDLGRVETISGVRATPPSPPAGGGEGGGIPRGYRISVWRAQVGGWQIVAEQSDNALPINISFAPIQTQFINIQLTQSSDKPWAIREVRVTKTMTEWVGPTG